ncbi:hypothetical protein, partial [Aeromonas caviae]|uniref:hypothetical protein n=1 Tax=Aeromonas caviae TaxID=648 RepID=UPI002B459665
MRERKDNSIKGKILDSRTYRQPDPGVESGLLAHYLATWFTLCKNMPETGAARLTPQSRKGLMRAVAQIAQSVEQGIENP